MPIPATMKAVVLHGADDMRVEEWPVPEPGPGEVLLKVEVASICGTDVKVLHRKLQGQPEGEFIMGHEYAGTVAALGPGVDEFRVGDRVAVEVHKGCERCENCIKGWYTSCLNYGNMAKGHRAKGLTCDGGFAEYAVNHINTLFRLPDNLTFEQACMVTTAASPLWALDLMGGYIAGETVLILGPGPIGLMAVQLCKALGAERVILTGTRDERLEIGRRLGADFTINVRNEKPARARGRDHERQGCRRRPGVRGRPRLHAGGARERQAGRAHRGRGLVRGPGRDGHEPRRAQQRAHLRGARRGRHELRPLPRADERGQARGRPADQHHFQLDQIHDAFRHVCQSSGQRSQSRHPV